MASSPLTPAQLEQLVSVAGKRLGITPEQLKAVFEQQGLAGIASLTGQAPADMTAVDSKEKAAQLLNDPRIQALVQQLLKDK